MHHGAQAIGLADLMRLLDLSVRRACAGASLPWPLQVKPAPARSGSFGQTRQIIPVVKALQEGR